MGQSLYVGECGDRRWPAKASSGAILRRRQKFRRLLLCYCHCAIHLGRCLADTGLRSVTVDGSSAVRACRRRMWIHGHSWLAVWSPGDLKDRDPIQQAPWQEIREYLGGRLDRPRARLAGVCDRPDHPPQGRQGRAALRLRFSVGITQTPSDNLCLCKSSTGIGSGCQGVTTSRRLGHPDQAKGTAGFAEDLRFLVLLRNKLPLAG